jgi:hypothetical protein
VLTKNDHVEEGFEKVDKLYYQEISNQDNICYKITYLLTEIP